MTDLAQSLLILCLAALVLLAFYCGDWALRDNTRMGWPGFWVLVACMIIGGVALWLK